MKNQFKEYFFPTEKDLDEIWKDSLIVLDTSVLLNLYKYTETTRRQYIDFLSQNKKRLWIPYQVGYEFFNNREKTIDDQEKAYLNIKNILEKEVKTINDSLNHFSKHASINIKDYQNKIKICFDEIQELLNEAEKKHPQFREGEDQILQIITSLYESNVGEDFDKDTLNRLYKNGVERYKLHIPPGFADAKSKESTGERNLYGDLIVWKQIIYKAKEEGKNIIFITDDRKEDWWKISNGQTISPRKELFKEFMVETEQRILIYKADNFLSYARERLNATIDEETIKEIKTLHVQDQLNKELDVTFEDLDFDVRGLWETELPKHYITPNGTFNYLIPDVKGLWEIEPRKYFINPGRTFNYLNPDVKGLWGRDTQNKFVIFDDENK